MPTSDGGLSGMEAAGYLHSAGFSGAALQTAIAIGKTESGLKMIRSLKQNTDGSWDWGFMQINDIHKPSDAVKTQPLANAKEAFRIYRAAGNSFKPWSTYKSGAYKANMEFARQSIHALQSAGPAYERSLIAGKNPGSADNPINLNGGNLQPNGNGGGLAGKLGLDSVPNAIGAGINAVNDQIGKVAGNALAISIAVVLLVLGVVILMRGAVAGGAIGVVRKAIK